MSNGILKLIVRTPRAVVWQGDAMSIRVLTQTGQVGIRPRMEPLVLAVEAGLILVRESAVMRFIGTAGGLLRCDGKVATILTPLAVSGENEQEVVDTLESALAQPSVEMEARATIGRLQTSIVRELREGSRESTPSLRGKNE